MTNVNGYNRRRRAWPPLVALRKMRELLSRETADTRRRTP